MSVTSRTTRQRPALGLPPPLRLRTRWRISAEGLRGSALGSHPSADNGSRADWWSGRLPWFDTRRGRPPEPASEPRQQLRLAGPPSGCQLARACKKAQNWRWPAELASLLG